MVCERKKVPEEDEAGIEKGDAKRSRSEVRGHGTEREREHPGDEGVEDGVGADVEEEVEGKVVVPWW